MSGCSVSTRQQMPLIIIQWAGLCPPARHLCGPLGQVTYFCTSICGMPVCVCLPLCVHMGCLYRDPRLTWESSSIAPRPYSLREGLPELLDMSRIESCCSKLSPLSEFQNCKLAATPPKYVHGCWRTQVLTRVQQTLATLSAKPSLRLLRGAHPVKEFQSTVIVS